MRMAALSLGCGGRIEIGRDAEAEAERGRGGAESTVGKGKRRGEGIGGKRRAGGVGEGAGLGPEKRKERTDYRGLVYDWWTIELYFIFYHF